MYLKRAEWARDAGLELLEGDRIASQDFAGAQRVNGFASRSGAPVSFRALQNQAVKKYIPKHRSSLQLSALALLLAVMKLRARCCCFSQLMKQV